MKVKNIRQIEVKLAAKSYFITITNNFDNFSQCISGHYKKCIILTDRNIAKLYLREFCLCCEELFQEVQVYIMEPGESNKSLQTVKKIYDFLIENAVCRQDLIVTFGGGVIGDAGGFAAATYLRGIPFIQVPTSLLAQADSSIGGKTAVNLDNIKNAVGAFYQPDAVYVNYGMLKTLPERELKNGLVEILVHAMIKDESMFFYIEENLEKIMKYDTKILDELIYQNCRIKSEVVMKDERETGERAILNFGHTFGHAIESCYNYTYSHGESVAIGMMGACYLAQKMQIITNELTDRLKTVLERMKVLQKLHDCDREKMIELLLHDKKCLNGKICFILPLKIGSVRKYEAVDMGDIREVLDQLIEMNE